MFKNLRKKIGIIGYGNMGAAIAQGIKSKYRVTVFDKDSAKLSGLKGLNIARNIFGLLKENQVIILAVKPQDFDLVLAQIKDNINGQLIISIAAGITTGYIEKNLGQARVVRVMPNLAAKVGKSVTTICRGAFALRADMRLAARLFKYLGVVFIFGEEMMDAATATAGSGPGFWCDLVKDMPQEEIEDYNREYFIPELSLAAENAGFKKKDAKKYASLTTSGSLATVEAWGIPPEVLRDKIASKGGTTQAGLEALRRTGSLVEAVRAAKLRSKELSK